MEFKINRLYELNNTLRVEVETVYGLDNFGLNLESKYLDPVTQKPKYMAEIKSLLEKKYVITYAAETEVVDSNVGITLDTDNI